uniref:Uncharacterized protein n=1 Tax=Malurus cyaneus samueli TaxID=2593467 RepID=A0A8C5X4P0_9PASS
SEREQINHEIPIRETPILETIQIAHIFSPDVRRGFLTHCIVPSMFQDDQTPLHISARLGKADIVQQLLQQGASPNAATTSGYTPLHLSAREGHEDVAAVLLDHGYGADANAVTRQGIAPLHLASQDGHVDMVSLLLSRNANVNLSNKGNLYCDLAQRATERTSSAPLPAKSTLGITHAAVEFINTALIYADLPKRAQRENFFPSTGAGTCHLSTSRMINTSMPAH